MQQPWKKSRKPAEPRDKSAGKEEEPARAAGPGVGFGKPAAAKLYDHPPTRGAGMQPRQPVAKLKERMEERMLKAMLTGDTTAVAEALAETMRGECA